MFSKLRDNMRVAFSGLRTNKLRSGLTMLGMTIGVAAVILLVSVGQAVEAFIVNEFSAFGSNWVQVSGTVSNTAEMTSMSTNESEVIQWFVPFSESDYAALSDPFCVPSASNLAAMVSVPLEVSYQGYRPEAAAMQIYGTTPSYMEILDVHAGVGRDFDDYDNETASRVALLGVEAADLLFEGQYPIGKEIRIGPINFTVIGVLEDFASSLDQDDNQIILVPITAAWKRLGVDRTLDGQYAISAIVAQAINQDAVDSLVDEMTDVLREEHNLDFDDDDDFQIIALTDILDTLNAITGLLTVFLALIASISLLVGGIGIMNIMLVTVTERTREIGLRKAVGAQKPDILTQFLTEAIVLALVGGMIGTGIAVGFSLLVSALVPDLVVQVQPSSILLATIITIGTGAFFGAYPANRAAGLNPIDALRHE
jgi:putative ABC transport system permease protein